MHFTTQKNDTNQQEMYRYLYAQQTLTYYIHVRINNTQCSTITFEEISTEQERNRIDGTKYFLNGWNWIKIVESGINFGLKSKFNSKNVKNLA
jgi:hypothetical protein